ncbi:MAG: hypothetical protein SX243_10160 [Acidobacteriota bacterium]|nr:hypothetical protein [Acidobacteriota bacterium]
MKSNPSPSPGAAGRRRLVLVFFGLLWAWGALGLAHALIEQRSQIRLAETQAVAPARWQLGSGQEKRLEHFLRQMTRDLPEGSRIGWTVPPEPNSSVFFLTRWATYHLPHSLIVPAGARRPSDDLDFWITYRRRLQRPDLEPVRELPQGSLYRVRKD